MKLRETCLQQYLVNPAIRKVREQVSIGMFMQDDDFDAIPVPTDDDESRPADKEQGCEEVMAELDKQLMMTRDLLVQLPVHKRRREVLELTARVKGWNAILRGHVNGEEDDSNRLGPEYVKGSMTKRRKSVTEKVSNLAPCDSFSPRFDMCSEFYGDSFSTRFQFVLIINLHITR